jgi:hypothetical protein
MDAKESGINVAELLNALDAWDAAHPIKTYAMDFLQKHPLCHTTFNGGVRVPDVCNKWVNGCNCPHGRIDNECRLCFATHSEEHAACWNQPMKEESK